jgi:hypothetical protein
MYCDRYQSTWVPNDETKIWTPDAVAFALAATSGRTYNNGFSWDYNAPNFEQYGYFSCDIRGCKRKPVSTVKVVAHVNLNGYEVQSNQSIWRVEGPPFKTKLFYDCIETTRSSSPCSVGHGSRYTDYTTDARYPSQAPYNGTVLPSRTATYYWDFNTWDSPAGVPRNPQSSDGWYHPPGGPVHTSQLTCNPKTTYKCKFVG